MGKNDKPQLSYLPLVGRSDGALALKKRSNSALKRAASGWGKALK
jgi:hypothetical protein